MSRRLAVVSAGIGQPSSTRMLADRLAEQGIEVEVTTHELRDVAVDAMNNMLTGFPSARLEEVVESVTGADGLIAVTPVFTASYSGLFKTFFDVIDNRALADMPVLIGATAGTARHSLALDFAVRPMFTYLHATVVPTGVFAASSDWGSAGDRVKTLHDRIERAAGEFAPLLAGSDRRGHTDDLWGFGSVIGPVGGFRPS